MLLGEKKKEGEREGKTTHNFTIEGHEVEVLDSFGSVVLHTLLKHGRSNHVTYVLVNERVAVS